LLSPKDETEDIMNNALTIIGIATLTMVGLSSDVLAQGRGPGAGGPGRHMAVLNLTAEQRQQIDQLREAAIKQSEPLRAPMAQKRDELRALWRMDQPDKSAIAQKEAELDTLRVQQRAIWMDFRFQAHGLLTPEQRSQWADRGGMGRGHGRGFGHGGPRGGGFGPGGFSHPDCPMRVR
jgi:Spy/CpxP family protein refolding chaperone